MTSSEGHDLRDEEHDKKQAEQEDQIEKRIRLGGPLSQGAVSRQHEDDIDAVSAA